MIKFEDYVEAIIKKEDFKQLSAQRGTIYYGNDEKKLAYSYGEDDSYCGEMTVSLEKGEKFEFRTGRRLYIHGVDYGKFKALAFHFFSGVADIGGSSVDFQYSIDGRDRGTIIKIDPFSRSSKTIELRNIPARDENGIRKVKVLVLDNEGKRVEEIGVEQLTTEIIIDKLYAILIDGVNNKEVLEGFEKVFEISKPALSLKVQDLLAKEWIREITAPVREAQERLKKIDGQTNAQNRERAEKVAYLLGKDTELDNLLYMASINSPIKDDTTGKFIEELIKQENMNLVSGKDFGKPDSFVDKNSGQMLTIKKTKGEFVSCALGTEKNGVLNILDRGNDGVDLCIDLSKVCDCLILIEMRDGQITVSYDYFHGDRAKLFVEYDKHGSHVGEVYSFWMTCDNGRAIRYKHPETYLKDSTIEGITNLILNVCQSVILNGDDEIYGERIKSNREQIDKKFELIEPIIRMGVRTTFMKGRIKTLQKAAENKRENLSTVETTEESGIIEKEIRSLESMAGDILWDIDISKGFIKNK